MPTRRDRGMTTLFLGFFAAVWFGWGHAVPTGQLGFWLDIGESLAVLMAVAGAVLSIRLPGAIPVLTDRSLGRRYGSVVGVEFGLAGVGGGVLGAVGHAELIPAWVSQPAPW